MATGNPAIRVALEKQTNVGSIFRRLLNRYFYFTASIVMAGLVVLGFGHTVDARLLHANPPRPILLWFHGMLFSAWMALFIMQSALVRLRRVSLHRALGWLGATLAVAMVGSSFTVTNVMMRFDITVLHRTNVASFLSILWCDMVIFGACMALAIYYRKRPEYHRRLVFLATCQLMQAAFVRLPSLGYHNLFYPALDMLIVAGLARDLVVDSRVHSVYRYGFPGMIVLQAWATYLQLVNPSWWQATTRSVLGV